MKNLSFYSIDFENAVRNSVNIFDRPITEEDVKSIEILDCSHFEFSNFDFENLIKFTNLKNLSLFTRCYKMNFLIYTKKLENLAIKIHIDINAFGFKYFSNVKHLRSLYVSGGNCMHVQLLFLDELNQLKFLKSITLDSFLNVDLSPIGNMTQIQELSCHYGTLYNADVISKLTNLKVLKLIGICVENLDFLNAFPDDINLELRKIHIKDKSDFRFLKRFTNAKISDITAE